MSNQVTFYSLADVVDKFEFATKLVSQLWRKEQRGNTNQEAVMPLWVLCDNQTALKQMDDLLWSLQQDSFIPHRIIPHYTEFDLVRQCVAVSLAMPIPQWEGIVINLSPYAISQFQNNTIIEIIGHTEKDKTIGRERYKHYQKLSFEIKHHRIDN